jgi:hypothetical protein
MSNISWFSEAACRGKTYYFFPHFSERPEAKDKREARARVICAQCPVILQCREYARASGEHGFWGGESEDERFDLGYINDPTLQRRQRARARRRHDREEREKTNTVGVVGRPKTNKTTTS